MKSLVYVLVAFVGAVSAVPAQKVKDPLLRAIEHPELVPVHEDVYIGQENADISPLAQGLLAPPQEGEKVVSKRHSCHKCGGGRGYGGGGYGGGGYGGGGYGGGHGGGYGQAAKVVVLPVVTVQKGWGGSRGHKGYGGGGYGGGGYGGYPGGGYGGGCQGNCGGGGYPVGGGSGSYSQSQSSSSSSSSSGSYGWGRK